MNHSYLGSRSPQKQTFRINSFADKPTVISMTCRQTQMFSIKYDDILYKQQKVHKIILCGLIVGLRDGKSPRGNLLKYMKIKDNTGLITVQAYQSPFWEELPKLMKAKKYVKVCVTAKCMGVPKLQIKLTLVSLRSIENGNSLVQHMIQVIQDEIQSQY